MAEGSTVKAKGDVTITSTKEDINIHGSSVEGENVHLNAATDLNVTASENTNKTKEDHTASSGSIGVTVGLGGVMGVDAGYSRGKENIKENSTTYNESTVKAKNDLTFESGKDTNIRGGAISGEKVTGKVGGDLNIESKKDSKDYESKSASSGLGISYNPASGGVSVTGGASKGSIESRYDSVTSQSGIYAGKEGFDISVEKNTDLKGAVIGSNAPAEKNQLTTGTLTWEDTKNKAEYEAGGVGINVNTSSGAKLNEKGITPSITPTVKGDADSTTKSAVAEGTITIKDKENQKQDIGELNRNMTNNLNKLGEIFDKDDVKERQELAGLFGEIAFNQIHYMEGTQEQKAIYHALVGGIMGELSHGDFLSGASGAMVNKMLMEKIKEAAHGDPAMMQWLSAAVGSAVSKVLTDNGIAGGSASASGTKNNDALEAELAAMHGASADEVKEADKLNVSDKNGPLDDEREAAGHVVLLGAAKFAVEQGFIPNPNTMKSDYVFVKLDAGAFKFIGASSGYIMDKYGNIYQFMEGSVAGGIGLPVSIGYGSGNVETKWLNVNGRSVDTYQDAIQGLSIGGGGSAIVGITASKSLSKDGAATIEVVATGSMGETLSIRYAEYIGNISEE